MAARNSASWVMRADALRMTVRCRCTECRKRFVASPKSGSRQRVCSEQCRVIRRRKLARRRRNQDLEGFRADERERQRRRRMSPAGGWVEPCERECHVPAWTSKSLEVREEIHRILDGPFRLSRAGFVRELWRIERKIGSLVSQAVTQNGQSWTRSRAASSG